MSQNAPRLERNATLDLLRLLAALGVVGFHYLFRGAAGEPMMATAYPEAAPVALYGYLGVNLFFLISGYVIAWSAEGRDWTDFAVARFARLYPGFVASMTLSFAVLLLAGSPLFPVSAAQFAANLFMVSPALGQPFMDGVYWSIVLELVFYFWVAAALMTGIFHRWKLELVAGWLLLCLVNEYAIGSGLLRMVFITEFGPLFAAGILLHHIQTRGTAAESGLLLAASFVLSCSLAGVTQDWMQGHYGISVSDLGLVAANTAIHALVIAAIVLRGHVPANHATLAVGGLTYPLYLLHQNIGYVAIDALTPSYGRWIALAVVVVAMVLVSWAIWRFVERPAGRGLAAMLTAMLARLLRLRPLSQPSSRATPTA